MKKIFQLFTFSLALAAVAPGQSREIVVLPATKTVAAYTEWLSEALVEFGFHEHDMGTVKEKVKIRDVTFRNCAVKLKTTTTLTRPSPPTRFGHPTPSSPPTETATYYVFDFAQLDEAKVLLFPSTRKNVKEVALSSVDSKPVIHIVSNPNSEAESSGTRSRVNLTLRSRAAEKIGEGIGVLIGLCKGSKIT